MTHDDELRVMRERLADVEARVERFASVAPGRVSAQAVQIVQGPGWVAGAGRFYLARPLDVSGATVEGGSASTVDTGGGDWHVRVIGAVPTPGDVLVARAADFRWHAERRGSGGDDDDVPTPGCPCATTPRTITMTSSKPLSNDQIFRDATLQYQDLPDWAITGLALPYQGHLSTETFVDVPTGDRFWYYLTCHQGYYLLTRIFEISVYGSPYRDVVRYRWQGGVAGNTCDPWAMTNGQMFSGGDSSCIVTLTQ